MQARAMRALCLSRYFPGWSDGGEFRQWRNEKAAADFSSDGLLCKKRLKHCCEA
jgi:hypothetical protein